MTKAKTASKNNPQTRSSAKKHHYKGQVVRPVKLISLTSTYFAAEYESNGELVMGEEGNALPWSIAINIK